MTHAFKIGMEVFIDSNRYGSGRPMQLCTVEKVTSTQFTAGGVRFKSDGDVGWRVGGYDNWSRVICRIATDELKANNTLTIKRRNAEHALSQIATFIDKLRDDDAVSAFEMLPQSIKDRLKS